MSHDRRFDGRLFAGVVTTGVYCRPICPVHPPKRENVIWFKSAAAAEAAGFRPCRRCHPQTSPGTPAWFGTSAVVSRALRLISEGALDEASIDQLAARVGIGGRHLRRLFVQHLGASPLQVARTNRVHFARNLIDETDLPMTGIALASGFGSIRQFNWAVHKSFGYSPTDLRMRRSRRLQSENGGLTVRLPYRPPLAWRAMVEFLKPRATPGVEVVENDCYRRTIELGGLAGMIAVRPAPDAHHLVMQVVMPRYEGLMQIVERARRIFDLGADPLQISSSLRRSAVLRDAIDATPGLRVPGAWDPFELAVRAVLGQQVTVKGATTLAGRLARAFGRHVDGLGTDLSHLFPSPEKLADADLSRIGMPGARAATVRALSRAAVSGELKLDGSQGLEDAVSHLCAIPGVGEWTAHYIAMRALGEPDAFPATDLGLRRALDGASDPVSGATLSAVAEAWRPWRAYAAMYLWLSAAKARGARADERGDAAPRAFADADADGASLAGV